MVPCGKCVSCRISRSREWTIRLLHEYAYHESTAFITLTYDDEHLPKDEEINKQELQRMFKRLRKEKANIKYYAIGEYGEKYGRPHYHAIMFGLSQEDTELIKNTWGKGRIDVGTVTQHSIRYVTDYIHKENRIELYDTRKPPFSLMSKGLGKQWAIDNEQHLIQNQGTTLNGQHVGVPKYYVKKLDFDKTEIIEKAKERSAAADQKLYEKMLKSWNFKSKRHTLSIKEEENRQRNLTAVAKQNLYKKGKF